MWKKVKDTDYEVSENGEIRNKKGRVLKPQLRGSGYYFVVIHGKTYQLHRLIAEAFIENPNKYPQINHIDGNKTNNDVRNLEWCNRSQNQIHAYAHKLQIPKRGSDNKQSKPVLMYSLDNVYIRCFNSLKEAADFCGCKNKNSYTNIASCCNEKINNAYGYKWKWK